MYPTFHMQNEENSYLYTFLCLMTYTYQLKIQDKKIKKLSMVWLYLFIYLGYCSMTCQIRCIKFNLHEK